MHTIKTPNLLFEYQCTSGKFIRLPNQIEKIDSVARIESNWNFFSPNWNALVIGLVNPHSNKDHWWQKHLGVNNLPRVITQPQPGQGSNLRPLDLVSDALLFCHHTTPTLHLLHVFPVRLGKPVPPVFFLYLSHKKILVLHTFFSGWMDFQ